MTRAIAIPMLACLVWLPMAAEAQPANLQQLFETGQYQAVIDNLPGQGSDPAMVYLAAQSHARLQQVAPATALLEQLASRPPANPWHHIGRAALLVRQGNLDGALAAANQAVALSDQPAAASTSRPARGRRGRPAAGTPARNAPATPVPPEAHYQLGLVLFARQEFPAAAAAFDAAAARRPSYAYALYQAGLSYYRQQRVDLMAARFEAFLTAAPTAPERTQVESIMRTVRGR